MSVLRTMLFMLAAKIKNQIQYFKSRVSADLGFFESESCIEAQLNTINNQNLLDSASLIVTPNAYKTNKLYSVVPFDATGDMTFTRATSATRVNSAGLIETVGNNIARLDYSNGSCPSILVEPQRTNLLLRSEEFNSAIWTKVNSPTITTNAEISPDGNYTADRIQNGVVLQNTAVANGVVYTASIWIKGTINGTTVIGTPSGAVFQTVNITTNWQRFTFTRTSSGSSEGIALYVYSGLVKDIYAWGAQLELGSNATSYIPTTTTTVTRNADLISKSGISSLIGQTEGTLFADVYINSFSSLGMILSTCIDETTVRIEIYKTTNGKINFDIIGSTGALSGVSSTSTFTGNVRLKIALGYKSGDTVMFINGIQETTVRTNSYDLIGQNRVGLGQNRSNAAIFNDRINSAILFSTRLSNSQLQQLTTL